ncbi:hypothetical protein ESZ50_08075, partial [Weissella muntiaci]
MSKKNKLKQLNKADEKKSFKAYKSNKAWIYASITSFVGMFGGSATLSSASADASDAGAQKAVETSNADVLVNKSSTTIPSVQTLQNSDSATNAEVTDFKVTGKYLDGENGNAQLLPSTVDYYLTGGTFKFPTAPDIPGKIIDIDKTTINIGGSEISLSTFAGAYEGDTGHKPNSVNDMIDWINSGAIGSLDVDDQTSDQEIDFYYRTDHSSFVGQNKTMDLGSVDGATFVPSSMVSTLINSTGSNVAPDTANITADTSKVNWNVAGSYTITLTYYDPTAAKNLTVDVVLTLNDAQSESMSDSELVSDSESVSDSE